jgi:hypothetical protein
VAGKKAKKNEKEAPEQAPLFLLLTRKEEFEKLREPAHKEREQSARS